MLSVAELMKLALKEAHKSPRTVRPNPRVGAALQSASGQIVLGHHQICGGPHAEQAVLAECARRGVSTLGARIAVSLEPCAHKGRTSSCAKALVAAKISEVICSVLDPNPSVNGRGRKLLEKAEIKVSQSHAAEGYALNREWLWAQKLRRPFVTLKMATSRNFVWKSAERRWITSEESRRHAMALRARADYLITSGATVRDDDPLMTVRGEALPDGSQPHILILSLNSSGSPVDLAKAKVSQMPTRRVSVESWPQLSDGLERLFAEGIFDVMIEAGPRLSEKFLQENLVDEIWHYQSADDLVGEAHDLSAYYATFVRSAPTSLLRDVLTVWSSPRIHEKEITGF